MRLGGAPQSPSSAPTRVWHRLGFTGPAQRQILHRLRRSDRGSTLRSVRVGGFPPLPERDPAKTTHVQKLALMSVIIASIVIPARAARMKSPQAGLKKVVKQITLFNLFYLFLLVFVVGRL